jgi:hypothetical protein
MYDFAFKGILNSVKQTTELSKKWEEIIPLTFYFDHLSDEERTEMSVKIYDFYFKKDFLQTTEANLTHVSNFPPEIVHKIKTL